MRKILFRGKSIYSGEWLYGSYLPNDYIVEFGEDRRSVDAETIGQWTGLVDKKGVQIFEGDIVKTDKFGEPNKIYVIEYNLLFGAFIGTDGYGMYFVTFDGDSDQFEVIGSIHDKAAEE